MNKFTQIIISIAGILVIITCLTILLRKPVNPNIEFIREWEKAKQESTNQPYDGPKVDDGEKFTL